MRVYSSSLNAFTSRLKAEAKNILSNEMGLSVRRSRFLFEGHLYPFSIVAFENPIKLGYFDANNFQIGINKNLIYLAKPEVLKNILRHELAHMYAHLIYGPSISAHGNHFKEVCRKFSWGSEVSNSYSDLEKENSLSSAPEFERILSKVKKLLKLAGSSNQHEASLATLKANELLLKYNLDHLGSSDQNEEVYVKNVYEVKRANVQMSSLYEILEFFYVQPVINRGSKKSYLEVIGTKVNVEMADYIAKFLLAEFERLYKASGLKGASAKNSFIRGISEGFTQKIKVNNSKDLQTQKELIHLRKNLQVQVEMVYAKMGSTTSSISKSNLTAKNMGKKAGSNLSINKSLNPKNFIKKLGFSK